MSKVVVIIPTYNERENIDKMIDVLEKEIFPKIKDTKMEILVVDDKSPDGTSEVVRQKMKLFPNVELSTGDKQGLGAAYIRGMKYAMEKMKADGVIEFDADFQHDPKYIIELVKEFHQGYDHVIGSRGVAGGSVPSQWGTGRKVLTKFGGLFSRFVLFFPKINAVRDTSTGLKLTKVAGVLDKIDFSKVSNGFFYKTQILFQIVKMGAKIKEIPLEFKLRELGESKMSMKDVVGTFTAVIMLRLHDSSTQRFLKFGTVGIVGFIINALGLEFFYRLGFATSLAAAMGAELSIISNFTLNNYWTFSEKQISGPSNFIKKFFQFNLSSVGAIIIQSVVVGVLTLFFGPAYRQIYLVIAVGCFVIPYNYTMYNVFIWKTWKNPFTKLFGRISK